MIRTLENARLQAMAMGASFYEIGILGPARPDCEPQMLTCVWDLDAIVKSIRWLCLENSRGRNIYIRPKGEHHLSLVDDLTWNSVKQMKAAGFQPAVLVQTSPGNFQAWLNHGRMLPADLSDDVAKSLAERFGGNVRAAAWRQYGRLAGFTNRKEKHKQLNGLFPIVKLVEVSARVYEQAEDFVAAAAAELERAKAVSVAGRTVVLSKSKPRKGIEDFGRNLQYGGDGNRIRPLSGYAGGWPAAISQRRDSTSIELSPSLVPVSGCCIDVKVKT
jgi:hypothetical protein